MPVAVRLLEDHQAETCLGVPPAGETWKATTARDTAEELSSPHPPQIVPQWYVM